MLNILSLILQYYNINMDFIYVKKLFKKIFKNQ